MAIDGVRLKMLPLWAFRISGSGSDEAAANGEGNASASQLLPEQIFYGPMLDLPSPEELCLSRLLLSLSFTVASATRWTMSLTCAKDWSMTTVPLNRHIRAFLLKK
jgi:hypothetical protein